MEWVGIRELKAKASEIIRRVREGKAEYGITYRGKPCGILLPVDEESLEDYLLASHPFFVQMRRESRAEIERGEYVTGEALLEDRDTPMAYTLIILKKVLRDIERLEAPLRKRIRQR